MTSYDSKAEIRLQSWQLGLSLARSQGLVPIPLCLSEFLSKIGTHLLASSDIMEKNRNSLCLPQKCRFLLIFRSVTGYGAADGLIPSRAGRVRVPGFFVFPEVVLPPPVFLELSPYIPMCSGVRPDQIIVPLYKGAWSDRTTLLSR